MQRNLIPIYLITSPNIVRIRHLLCRAAISTLLPSHYKPRKRKRTWVRIVSFLWSIFWKFRGILSAHLLDNNRIKYSHTPNYLYPRIVLEKLPQWIRKRAQRTTEETPPLHEENNCWNQNWWKRINFDVLSSSSSLSLTVHQLLRAWSLTPPTFWTPNI